MRTVTSPAVPRAPVSARTKLLVSLAAAIAGGTAAAVAGAVRAAPLIGWDILALVFGVLMCSAVWRLDAESTESDAKREDPSRDLADVVLLGAAMASLIAVGVVLIAARHASGDLKYLQAAFGLVSVFVSWALVHTVFTVKYTRLYYSGQAGGIDFNETGRPQYSDFAYLSFTIGMTFQASDTNIQTKQIRRTAPTARLAVVSPGCRDHRDDDQPRCRTGRMIEAASVLDAELLSVRQVAHQLQVAADMHPMAVGRDLRRRRPVPQVSASGSPYGRLRPAQADLRHRRGTCRYPGGAAVDVPALTRLGE